MLDYKIFEHRFKLPEFKIDKDIELEIEIYYDMYIQRVSRRDMSISLQASIWLYYILENYGIRNHRIIDFGSGFSSYVIRLYQKNNSNIKVYTVDDSQIWLYETYEFLKDRKVNLDNLFFWENVKEGKHHEELYGQFDIVFYDLGDMNTRKSSFDMVKKRFFSHDKTLLILDDLHNGTYRNYLEDYVNTKGDVVMYSVKKYTLDSYGRYLSIIT